ncbi:MAG: FHA domain-containing protein [Deltaproteobacteria bacterium]|nr:FHA domain-containing protein [Deltaproteobacteria bacterium]MBW2390226.1 FHA domain-containing protein [Deltaproteobacteria bacterium]
MAKVARKEAGRQIPTNFVGGSPPAQKPEDASFLLELSRREAYLVFASGPRRQAEHALHAGVKTVLGRDESADLIIDDESASRRHAVIEKRADVYYLRDLGSANGTYLNGLLHAKEARLCEGQRFRIGETEFIFHDETHDETHDEGAS